MAEHSKDSLHSPGDQDAGAVREVKRDGQRLGRGLSALLGDMANSNQSLHHSVNGTAEQRSVAYELIRPNPHNPRRSFRDEQLSELAQSIREKGIIQPIVVRPVSDTPFQYEIIAGERRWRAAQLAQLQNVPVVVLNVDGRMAAELAMIENIQREDLNPIEEAEGYQFLISQNGYTQDALAQIVGKSRSYVTNLLRLLKLPERVRSYLKDGQLSTGHAKVLVGADDADALADKIVSQGLSVRETEALLAGRQAQNGKQDGHGNRASLLGADMRALEARLKRALDFPLDVKDSGGKGYIKFPYKDTDELEALVEYLTQLRN